MPVSSSRSRLCSALSRVSAQESMPLCAHWVVRLGSMTAPSYPTQNFALRLPREIDRRSNLQFNLGVHTARGRCVPQHLVGLSMFASGTDSLTDDGIDMPSSSERSIHCIELDCMQPRGSIEHTVDRELSVSGLNFLHLIFEAPMQRKPKFSPRQQDESRATASQGPKIRVPGLH